jgi:hypothetical protein
MLDTGYVYMDIYLPTLVAGRVEVGTIRPAPFGVMRGCFQRVFRFLHP